MWKEEGGATRLGLVVWELGLVGEVGEEDPVEEEVVEQAGEAGGVGGRERKVEVELRWWRRV